MLKRFGLALAAILLIGAPAAPTLAQGISQKVAVCDPAYTGRCIAPLTDGSIKTTPAAGSTGDVNLKQVNGATTNVGVGAAGTGTQRVTTSTDSTIATITNPVSVTGTGTAGTPAAGVVTVQGAAAMIPIFAAPTTTAGTALTNVATSLDDVVVSALITRPNVVNMNMGFDGTNYDRLRTIQGADTTGLGVMATAAAPTSAAGGAITPTATSALASSLVAKASAGNLYAWRVTAGASAGYVMIFNATAAPADGAVTPLDCVAVAANATVGSNLVMPERFGTGITLVFSTTGCFLKTASATAFIRATAQ